MSETTEHVDQIRRYIQNVTEDLDPQVRVNVLSELESDLEAMIDTMKEEEGVEPE